MVYYNAVQSVLAGAIELLDWVKPNSKLLEWLLPRNDGRWASSRSAETKPARGPECQSLRPERAASCPLAFSGPVPSARVLQESDLRPRSLLVPPWLVACCSLLRCRCVRGVHRRMGHGGIW